MPDKIKELCTPYCKVVAGYIVAASIWIFLGDWLIFALLPEKADMFYIGLLKGLGFIFFTALALHFLLRKNPDSDSTRKEGQALHVGLSTASMLSTVFAA